MDIDHEVISLRHKIRAAVQPHFEKVSPQRLISLESAYPRTLVAFFELCERVHDGLYGEKLRDSFELVPEEKSDEAILALLLVDVAIHSQANPPEIFRHVELPFPEMQANSVAPLFIKNHTPLMSEEKHLAEWIEISLRSIPVEVRKVLAQIFRRYISHFANLSHFTVDLYLQMGRFDDALILAKTIKNPQEKSKALCELVHKFCQIGRLEEAQVLMALIESKSEKNKAIIYLIDCWIHAQQIAQAETFIKDLPDLGERDTAQRELIIRLGKTGKTDKAFEIALALQDSDLRNYALSNLARVVASKGRLKEAETISAAITDTEFRQDAVSYIVKALLHVKKVEQAIRYVEGLPAPEKTNAAKIIESAMVSHRQDEKVKKLRRLFSLMKAPVHPD